jgi:hypothetical protein
MAVETDRAIKDERDGETHWFCSRGCRQEYLGRLPADDSTESTDDGRSAWRRVLDPILPRQGRG